LVIVVGLLGVRDRLIARFGESPQTAENGDGHRPATGPGTLPALGFCNLGWSRLPGVAGGRGEG